MTRPNGTSARHDAAAAPATSAGPMSVLVTGFGPFPGARWNPTGALVATLAKRRRPALSGLRLVAHVFPTSYAAVDHDLPRLLRAHRPDVILMFGLAARTPHVRVETRARNRRSVLLPDVAGVLSAGVANAADKAGALAGRAPFVRLRVAAQRARVPARLSGDAGRYLCNYLYRRVLQLGPGGAPRVACFIHVPKVRPGGRPRGRLRRRMLAAADLARAGEAILLALVAEARRPVSHSGTERWRGA